MNKFILVTILMFVAIILPAVPATTVSNVTILPAGDVMAGTIVTAEFVVKLSPTEKYTVDPDRSLKLFTELERAHWEQRIILAGVTGNPRIAAGNLLTIPGWQLAYPLGTAEEIRISLYGIAPAVSESRTTTIFSSEEINLGGMTIEGTEQSFGKLTINAADIGYMVSKYEKDLKQLRLDIVQFNQSWHGRGTGPAEILYSQASAGVDYLKTLQPSQYVVGVNRSNEIAAAIEGSHDALNRQNVQFHIDNATIASGNVSGIIGWFDQQNITSYPGMSDIKEQYYRANSLIFAASQAQTMKNWDLAITDADLALKLSRETYEKALAMQNRVRDPFTVIWDNSFIVLIIAGAVAVYLLFRKPKKKPKKRKPEPAPEPEQKV